MIATSVDDMDTGVLGRQRRHRTHERKHARIGLSCWWCEELMPRDCQAQLLASMEDLRNGHDRDVNRNNLARMQPLGFVKGLERQEIRGQHWIEFSQ